MEGKNVVTDLCDRMELLYSRWTVVFTKAEVPAYPPFVPLAEALAEGLAEGTKAAVRIARGVVDPGDLDDPQFWGTPLGRLLFAAGGCKDEMISQATAAAVLGCTRQWVSTLVGKGRLSHTVDSAVFTDEVRALLTLKLKAQVDSNVK